MPNDTEFQQAQIAGQPVTQPEAMTSDPAPTPNEPVVTPPTPSHEASVAESDAPVSMADEAEDLLYRGVVGGVNDAIRGTAKSVEGAASLVGVDAPSIDDHLAKIPEPKRVSSAIVRDFTQFTIGIIGAGKFMDAAKIGTKLPEVLKGMIASAGGTAAVADPNEPRLANIVEKYPFLQNPITNYLQAKPDDGIAEGKLKAALEDVMTAPVAMLIVKAVKAAKTGMFDEADLAATAKAANEPGAVPDEAFPHRITPEGEIVVPEVKVSAAAPEPPAKEVDPTLWDTPEQTVTSAATSINSKKLPAVFSKLEKEGALKQGGVNLDIGGGKFDNASEFLDSKGVKNHIFDPFNRTAEQNAEAVAKAANGQADTVTISNVLNVIEDEANQLKVLRQADNALKEDGTAYITVYEGKGDAVGGVTKAGFQHNKKLSDYLDLVRQVFPNSTIKNNMIIAKRGELPPKGPTQDEVIRAAAAEDGVQLPPAQSVIPDPKFTLTPEQTQQALREIDEIAATGSTDNLIAPLKFAFNYETWKSGIETRQVVEDVARLIKPQVNKYVKNYQSFKSIKAEADFFETTPEKLFGNLAALGVKADDMAATIVAAKGMMQNLGQDIYKLAKQIDLGEGGDSAKLEMVRYIDILADLEGYTKAVQTAAARTTAAGRIRTTARYTGKELREMLDEVGGSESVTRLASRLALTDGDVKAIRRVIPEETWAKKAIDSHNEIWINGILGPKTHAVNILSAVMQTAKRPLDMITGGLVSGQWGEVKRGVRIYGALTDQAFDSLKMARRAWKHETAILDPNQAQIETGISRSISAKNWGVDENDILGQGVEYLGQTIGLSSRAMKFEDEFFKQMNYRAFVKADLIGKAADMVKAGQMTEAEAGKFIEREFDNAFQLVPDGTGVSKGQGLSKAALRYAQEVTFTQSLKSEVWMGRESLSHSLQMFVNAQPAVRGLVLPFVKVPANIMREFGDGTPLVAPLTKRFWSDINEGGAKRALALGKLSTGSLLWTAGATLAFQGKITGAAPGDPKLRAEMEATGWRSYSYVWDKEDGTKEYIPFNRLDPNAMFFGLAADYYALYNSVDKKTQDSLATAMVASLAMNISSKSYLRGIVDQAAMLGGDGNAVDRANRLLQMKAGSYVPWWVSSLNTDTEMKQVRSVMDAILARTPGFSTTVEARRDYFGEKKMQPVGYPWTALSPIQPSDGNNDPVKAELSRLAQSNVQARFSSPPEKLGNIDLTKWKNSNGQTAYDRFQELMGVVKDRNGRSFHEALAELIGSQEYKDANDGTAEYPRGWRVDRIHETERKFREYAKDQLLNEFEDEFLTGKIPFNLQEKVREDAENRKGVSRGGQPINPLLDAATLDKENAKVSKDPLAGIKKFLAP